MASAEESALPAQWGSQSRAGDSSPVLRAWLLFSSWSWTMHLAQECTPLLLVPSLHRFGLSSLLGREMQPTGSRGCSAFSGGSWGVCRISLSQFTKGLCGRRLAAPVTPFFSFTTMKPCCSFLPRVWGGGPWRPWTEGAFGHFRTALPATKALSL